MAAVLLPLSLYCWQDPAADTVMHSARLWMERSASAAVNSAHHQHALTPEPCERTSHVCTSDQQSFRIHSHTVEPNDGSLGSIEQMHVPVFLHLC